MTVANTSHRLHNTILANIEAVKEAEKITKKALAELSRDLLTYVVDSSDIDMANRLIGVLTPMNRETAIAFFKHFLPHSVEETADGQFNRFGKRLEKEKQIKRRIDAINEFLSDESNNIWTWAGENLEVTKKTRDLGGSLTKAVKEALEGKEESKGFEAAEPLTHEEVIGAVLAGGVSIDDLFSVLDKFTAEVEDGAETKEVAA